MARRVKINVPDSFVESLNELILRVHEEDEEAKKQTALRKQAEREREREQKEVRIKKGFKHAKEIFAWLEAFRESEIGQILIRIGHISVDGVFIFDGHVSQKGWIGIGVGGQGVWWTRTGCGAREYYVQSPLELAEQVDPEILKLAHEWIKEDKVWECIKERIDTYRAKSKEIFDMMARFNKGEI